MFFPPWFNDARAFECTNTVSDTYHASLITYDFMHWCPFL